MMRRILKFAAIGFLVAATAAAFGGDERAQRSVFVSAGREARIASYGVPDGKCEGRAEPTIQIVEWPSYGTLADKPVRIIAERAGVARRDHPCLGRFITSLALYYRPTTGFRGSDRIRLRVKFPATGPQEETVIRDEEIFITVR
jgi:predicted secreted protein